MQDLQRQLDALYDLRGFLELFRNELENQLNGYRNRTLNLRETGISTQVASTYESSCYTVNEGYLKQVIRNISEDDLPYIHRQIEIIEIAIEGARR
ncbi:hypothetical protein FACS189434_08240 [Bacteroidia bacterium]|nr:hypothetical protein FACS189434_08240 [Bacteroidia bacterium]